MDKPQAAREHLTAALALYQDMGMNWWIDPTCTEAAALRMDSAAQRLAS